MTHDAKRFRSLMERLEDRVLFDAVPDGGFLIQPEAMEQPLVSQEQLHNQQSIDQQTAELPQSDQPRELILVDSNVEDADALISSILEENPDRSYEVRLLNSEQDGISQISAILDQAEGSISAIHVLSHGSEGSIQLGASRLDANSLSGHAAEIAGWADALTAEADLLFYGCNLAGDASGEELIDTLAALTGADVAASDDLTGNTAAGGDWDLEKQVGTIEAQVLSASDYQGTLLETDNGFVVGTETFDNLSETAVVPQGQAGQSSVTYTGAATANNGAITIDLRLTLVDTFDENGNVTTGTTDQLPVTFSDFDGGPILLARTVGNSVSGFEGHTAHVMIEFIDASNGAPLSVVGDFTFKDIDWEAPTANGSGNEGVTVVSDQLATYSISSDPPTEIDVIDNGDGTTTFTNDSSRGDADDQERWVSTRFHSMPQLNLRFEARNANTGYGLSTADFSEQPLSFSQPVAQDDDFATDQNTIINGNVITQDNGHGVDSDPENDPLEVFLVDGIAANMGSSTSGDNGGQFTFNSDGSYSFDPNGDFDYLAPGDTATTSIEYTIRDDSALASTATVTVTITGTNDDPTTVNSIPDQSHNDGQPITGLNVSSYFDDVDNGQSLSYTANNTLPPGLSINPNTGVISGLLDNSASLSGPFTVDITADDGVGGTVTQTFTWAVANPGPVATDNTNSVNEDGPDVSGNVISDDDNGAGVDNDPDNDAISVIAIAGGTVDGTTNGTYGSIELNNDGSYSYSLDNTNPAVNSLGVNETLAETFSYTISDGEGGTDTATLSITINGSNDAPIVGSLILPQSNQDNDSVTPLNVSTSFSDPEGGTLTFSAANLPTGLSINPNTGVIFGQLDNSASQNAPGGVFLVTVTAQDGNGENVSTTFNWTVTNPGPVAQNDSENTDQDSSVSGNVLSNDSDIDADTITVNSINGPGAIISFPVDGSNGGEFTINPDGSFNFDPSGDFDYLGVGETASTSISYQITDSEGGTDTATLMLSSQESMTLRLSGLRFQIKSAKTMILLIL